MATRLTERDQEFTSVYTRIPVNADQEKSWKHIEETIEKAERDTLVVKVDDMALHNGNLVLSDRELGLAAGGRSALYRQFGIEGALQSYGLLSTDEHKAVADKALETLTKMVMEERKNSFLRLHTATVDGEQKLIYVSNAKVNQPRVIDQFNIIREASKLLNLRPIEFSNALDYVQMKLVEVDSNWELTAREDSLHGHEFFGDRKSDKFYGMITVGLSETKVNNKLRTGTYAEICENGAVIENDADAVTLEAVAKAKGSFQAFLRTAFEVVSGRSAKFQKAIDAMSTKTFSSDDLYALQKAIESKNIQRPWDKFVKDDVIALTDHASRRKVFDLITLKGHDTRIPIIARHRFEEIGGQMLSLNMS